MILSKATAVVALACAGTALCARPPGKPAAKPSNTGSGLMAAASRLQFPNISTGTCPARLTCQDIESQEKLMLQLINADRIDPGNRAETRGCAHPLTWDPRLARAALAHSQEMAARHYFSHVDPNGQSPIERFYYAGIQWTAMGENIAKDPTAKGAEENFMSEPHFKRNHRANILDSKFNRIGIGIARGPDGILYITQDFAQEP
ncbi:MAG: CAP domain-containing protein [Terriglobia bacterium]